MARGLTGSYLASEDGYWSGQDGYSISKALYAFTFSNYTASSEEFLQLFNSWGEAEQKLNLVGRSQKQTLAVNLILLQSTIWTLATGSNIQVARYTAHPAFIYSRELSYISFSSSGGQCWYPRHVSMDQTTAVMTVDSIDISAFNKTCGSVALFEEMGYSSTFNGNYFSLKFDMRSVVTALALNFRFLTWDHLSLVDNNADIAEIQFVYGDFKYYARQYFDDKFVGMNPIYCVSKSLLFETENESIFQFCLIRLSATFAMPLTNSLGDVSDLDEDNIMPMYCDWYVYVVHEC